MCVTLLVHEIQALKQLHSDIARIFLFNEALTIQFAYVFSHIAVFYVFHRDAQEVCFLVHIPSICFDKIRLILEICQPVSIVSRIFNEHRLSPLLVRIHGELPAHADNRAIWNLYAF